MRLQLTSLPMDKMEAGAIYKPCLALTSRLRGHNASECVIET